MKKGGYRGKKFDKNYKKNAAPKEVVVVKEIKEEVKVAKV